MSTAHVSAPTHRAQHLFRVLLLGLGALALLYIVFSLTMQAYLPSDGVLLTEFSAAGLRVATHLAPSDSPLHVGDQIVGVEGIAIEEWAARTWRGEGVRVQWQVGQTITYQIIRDGVTQEIAVTLRDFSWGYLPMIRFGVYALAILSLVIAVYILLRQPADTAAHLLCVVAVCMTVVLALHFQVMTLVTPALLLVESLLKFFARTVLFSAILHLFLIFPVSRIKSKSIRPYLWLLHLINPLLAIALGFMFERTPLARWLLMSRIASWLGLLMFFAGLVSIVHAYFTERQPLVQGQIRWLTWGSVVGFLPYILLTGLPEAVQGHPWVTIEVSAFFLTALPLSVAVAVARYRLFDIGPLISHTLLYTVFSVTLLAVYGLLWRGLSGLWQTLALETPALEMNVSVLTFFITLIVVSLFWLMLPWVSHYAERLYYRRRIRPQDLLSQMTAQLTSKIHLDELAVLLSQTLPQQIGATRGGLMVLNEAHTALELLGQDGFTLPLGPWFDLWHTLGNVPILRSVPHPELPPEVLTLMHTRKVELILPLQVGTQFVGLLSFGTRVNALAYTTSEIRTLRSLAHQAALAVQNALLVRNIESSRRRLQDAVAQQTQAMAKDRNRLNAILQNMADALLVTDAAGLIQVVNPALENLIRRASRSVLGQPVAQVLPLPDLLQTITQALAHPGIIEISQMLLTDVYQTSPLGHASNARIISASVTAIRDRSAVICILRDVTHEVEIDRLKSDFISTVSHELRTPITSILGFVKLIQRGFTRTIEPALPVEKAVRRVAKRIQKNLAIILQEGERLTSLIHDVLDISALDSETMEWTDQAYQLAPLLDAVTAHFRPMVEQKGLTLRSQIHGPFPLMFADPARIQQVLRNILSNALKFTPQGEIVLAARLLALDSVVHNWVVPSTGGVLISVADTGIGIPPALLHRIFDRFSQGGDPLTSKPDGTGLGLALSREIVHHYGGILWSESQVDVGSTFFIALPILLPPEQAVEGAFESA